MATHAYNPRIRKAEVGGPPNSRQFVSRNKAQVEPFILHLMGASSAACIFTVNVSCWFPLRTEDVWLSTIHTLRLRLQGGGTKKSLEDLTLRTVLSWRG